MASIPGGMMRKRLRPHSAPAMGCGVSGTESHKASASGGLWGKALSFPNFCAAKKGEAFLPLPLIVRAIGLAVIQLAEGLELNILDDDIIHGHIVRIGFNAGNGIYHIHALDHLTKDGVTVIQPGSAADLLVLGNNLVAEDIGQAIHLADQRRVGGVGLYDEELASIGVFTAVCHGQGAAEVVQLSLIHI